ncbi:hypothetical protein AJ78_03370 [Emergomyces pasteurianus Ep9510]|uniref:Uncharacterized protein n=1 Tax=Emergomyces pasteurianus Ep9510 TaxID=1447872 RepID=A0A1J9QJX5_9EURO|nr:hypothetical protein AJ78_03370 [Emergomyces pasteurianus Ep9510]
MGQKHNRRRTRPRSRHHSNVTWNQNQPPLAALTLRHPPCDRRGSLSIPLSSPPTFNVPCYQQSPITQQWQSRYGALQSRECRQIQDAAKLEAEQFRLFGGVPGDDVVLCYRMLEYFGGLDYIDS